MNSDTGVGNRGEHIKPTARRSIHWHQNYCPFARGEVAMGRYGVLTKSPQNEKAISPKPADTGCDEVDNVISKHAYSLSREIRQNRKQRRNSLVEQDLDYSSDDSKRLSKSLPEKNSSHLYYSQVSNAEQNESETSSPSPYQSFQSNQSSWRAESIQKSPIYVQESAKKSPISEKQSQLNLQGKPQIKDTSYKIWSILSVILCILLACYASSDWLTMMPDTKIISPGKSYDKSKFYNDMSAVGEMYNLNHDSILQLQSGISSISEKGDTDSFIFVYNSERHNFNSTVFNEFINHIALVSAKYLRNESASVRHIVVDSSNIVVKDTDELIHKYSKDIEKGGVMVMKKIDTLPSSLAMALHYYCDVYNPLVKKSAIFFTLDIANCSDKISTHAHIEKCLKRKWSSVSSEFIIPLLARVVSVVVDVTSLF